MTAREEFLAGLEAEYHDDTALRSLTNPAPGFVLELGDFSWGVLMPAGSTPEEVQRVLDLWGDLDDEAVPDPWRWYEGLDLNLVCGAGMPQGGCGHLQGQHEYGLDLAPCAEQGCTCREFR